MAPTHGEPFNDSSALIDFAINRVNPRKQWFSPVKEPRKLDQKHNCLVQVAKMVAKEFTVDLNKPLAFQVGHLGDTYQEWVHRPILTTKSPRFFQSDILEFLTRTVWWAVPTIWLPVAFWCISISIRMGLTLSQIGLMVVFGCFMWTFLEYIFHRFVFHIETKSYWGNTFHYFVHGYHHKHPMDGLRLVLPPAEVFVLALLFWHLCKLLFTPSTGPALFGGLLIGYVTYDMVHYYVHHGQPSKQVIKTLKRYHLNHHFKIQNKGFGITTALWDRAFGTLPQKKAAEKSR